MKKKGTSQKSAVSSYNFNSHQPQSSATHTQPFWFRLWMGFLIGANIAYVMMAIYVLTNPKLSVVLPSEQGIFFIIIGLVDIWFMISLLRWHKWGLYGTIGITLISLLLNLYWGASAFNSLMYAIIPVGITVAFVLPKWSQYK